VDLLTFRRKVYFVEPQVPTAVRCPRRSRPVGAGFSATDSTTPRKGGYSMSENENIAVLIGNLPQDVTVEDLEDGLEGLGYDLQVSLVKDGEKDQLIAIVRFDGMTRVIADKIAAMIRGVPLRGKTLNAYVPLFWK
jgi:hypothetical protein